MVDELTYSTESDVRGFVLFRHFKVNTEVSLFSYRPDIVVVRHAQLGVVLVVEVKKPGEMVFRSPEAAGQVFDHVLGQTSGGATTRFAVLSTYDEMVIAIPNYNYEIREKCMELLERNAKNLNIKFDPPSIIEDTISSTAEGEDGYQSDPHEDSAVNQRFQATPSAAARRQNSAITRTGPDSEHRKVLDGLQRDGERSAAEEDEMEDPFDHNWHERKICYSQTFCGKDIVAALMLALRCGLESLATAKKTPLPNHNGSAEGTCGLADATSIQWMDIPNRFASITQCFLDPTPRNSFCERILDEVALVEYSWHAIQTDVFAQSSCSSSTNGSCSRCQGKNARPPGRG